MVQIIRQASVKSAKSLIQEHYDKLEKILLLKTGQTVK